MEATAGVAAIGPTGERPKPSGVPARPYPMRRPAQPAHAVTVKRDEIAASSAPVFVRVDVSAETYAEAEAELREAYSLAKSQLAAAQIAEGILATPTAVEQ